MPCHATPACLLTIAYRVRDRMLKRRSTGRVIDLGRLCLNTHVTPYREARRAWAVRNIPLALQQAGSHAGAARLLGISRSTLYAAIRAMSHTSLTGTKHP